MLYDSDRALKAIASNPSTSPSLLAELSNNSDSEIRFLVAINPNTQNDILLKLGEEFPEAIIENPVFNLLEIEEPNSRFVRLSLARSAKTSPEILAKLAATEKDDESICCAVARNINTPIETLKSLRGWRADGDDGDHPRVRVTREVINNPNLTISCLQEILDRYIDSGCCWDELFWEFSKLSNLSMEMIEKLAEKYGTDVLLIERLVVQESPNILDKIAHHSSNDSVLIKIIQNPVTLDSTIEYLATHSSWEVQKAIINRSNVSQKALNIISFIQGKPGVPVDLLNELAEDSRLYILRLLTKYHYTPPEILEKIANFRYYDRVAGRDLDSLDYWDILDNLAIHPNTSSEVLNRILNKLEQIILINGRKLDPRESRIFMVKKRLGYDLKNLYKPTPEDEIPF